MDDIQVWREAGRLFDASLEREDEDRADFIRSAASNAKVADEAISLLESLQASADFLEPTSPDENPTLGLGTCLGPWRIDALIGQGGMGDVYKVLRADGLYEQEAALKHMKLLPDSYLPLFARERQMLARLDHPGIARLLDGGMASDGRPWMVMELATGLPIDMWIEKRKCSPRDIVGLMIQVCEAIADAHAKLIVHRDIKPSNILVDDSGRCRVIDFGVAQFDETDGGGVMPLSLEYAAPEILAGKAATTASDVYGLAACLYRLLAGRPPLELVTCPPAVAVRRAVDEPPAPVSQFLENGLRGSLVRDLNSVLKKALAKLPADRHHSVQSFSDDLARALNGRPVSTRLTERGYVASRFVRRHAWQVAASVVLLASLTGGLSISLWQTGLANIEREAALREQERLEAVQQYLYFMLRDGADLSGGTDSSARAILQAAARQVADLFASDPVRGGAVMHALAELYLYLGDYEAAGPLLSRVAEAPETEPSVRASALYDLAQYHLRTGQPDVAAEQLSRAQTFWNQDPGMWRRRLVDSRLVEARLLRDRGQVEEGIALLAANLPERIALSGENRRETGVYHNDLGVLLVAAGRRDEAATSFRNAVAVWEASSLENSPDALNTLNNLAAIEALSGRHDAAEPLFRRAVELRTTLYGPSAATAALLSNYGKTLLRIGRSQQALPHLRTATAMAREHAGPASLHHASALAGLIEAIANTGESARALAMAIEGHAELNNTLGDAHPATAVVAVALAREMASSDPARASRLLNAAEAAFVPLGAGGTAQMEAIEQIRNRYGLARSTG